MGIFDRFLSGLDKDLSPGAMRGRALTADRPEPTNVIDGRFWGDEFFLNLPLTAATADQAAKVSAVNFCVSIIAVTLGSLGLDFVDSDGETVDLPIADTLAYSPNELQTGAEFWSSMAFAAALRNEAFAEPVPTADGIALWPLDPLRTTAEWGERSLEVIYTRAEGGQRKLGPGHYAAGQVCLTRMDAAGIETTVLMEWPDKVGEVVDPTLAPGPIGAAPVFSPVTTVTA